MEEGKRLQKVGNAHFADGRFSEALESYAAALAAVLGLELKDEELEPVVRSLHSNRSLCYLKLGQGEQALKEAKDCQEWSPEWPKAQFRLAAAHEFLGKLGDARLAACEGRRLAPEDKELERLQSQLRKRIFNGKAAEMGEALDSLEDFTGSASEAASKAVIAAQKVYDMLIGHSASQECVRAYVAGKGADTVFRRQQAMGDSWHEECTNGTMSLLSKLASAWPKLVKEVQEPSHDHGHGHGHGHGHIHDHGHVHDHDQKAEEVERKPSSSLRSYAREQWPDTEEAFVRKPVPATFLSRPAYCTRATPPTAGKAGDKAIEKEPPAPLKEEPRPGREGGKKKGGSLKEGFLKGQTLGGGVAGEKAVAPVAGPVRVQAVPAVAQERPSEKTAPAAGEWLLRILLMLPVDNMPFAFGAYQAVSRRWRAAAMASLLCDDVSNGAAALFSSWAERLRPGISELLTRGCSLHLVKSMRRKLGPPKALAGPEQWVFVVDCWRDARLLWSTLLDGSNFLPGMRDSDCAAEAGAAAPEVWPNVMEKMDVILPGDRRRLSVAGCIAALTALLKEKEEGCPYPEGEHAANVTAVHVSSGVSRVVPAVLMPGTRRSATAAVPVGDAPRALLRAVVGLGARQVMPGPKAAYPSGSLEVGTGLAFLGPDGRWLQGGAFVLTALLGALA